MNRLFVYGIFLDQAMRDMYGMYNAQYATVKDYITQGEHIVEAVEVHPKYDAALTGLTVNVDPSFKYDGREEIWAALDRLERNYDRKIVTTTDKEKVYMYVRRQI